jgi:hypothetical protein
MGCCARTAPDRRRSRRASAGPASPKAFAASTTGAPGPVPTAVVRRRLAGSAAAAAATLAASRSAWDCRSRRTTPGERRGRKRAAVSGRATGDAGRTAYAHGSARARARAPCRRRGLPRMSDRDPARLQAADGEGRRLSPAARWFDVLRPLRGPRSPDVITLPGRSNRRPEAAALTTGLRTRPTPTWRCRSCPAP